MGDPAYNFFKAVDAARQRNTTAFSQVHPMERSDAPQKARAHIKVSSPSLFQAYGNKPVLGSAVATTAAAHPAKAKILGGFFDAYA